MEFFVAMMQVDLACLHLWPVSRDGSRGEYHRSHGLGGEGRGGEGKTLLPPVAQVGSSAGKGGTSCKNGIEQGSFIYNRTKQKQTFSPKWPVQGPRVLRRLPPGV